MRRRSIPRATGFAAFLAATSPLLAATQAAAATPAPAAALQADPTLRDTVDVTVAAFLAEREIPGASVAILENGRLVKARGYGLADVEHRVPVTAETLFQSGSLGKQFTAAAVLLLAEDGRLDLDDPLTRHFDDAPASWANITVRHLLTHTSGLGAYEDRVDFRRDYTETELVAEIAAAPPIFEPGAEWSYSNSGYVLLGVLVSRLTGAHWGAFLEERVFGPAGMETAGVISESDIVPHRASGYRLEDGALKNQDWVSPTFLRTGDGALYFSILDLVRWDQALRGDGVLSEASKRAMWTAATLTDGSPVAYGFGWDVVGPPDRHHVGHGGAWQGFRTYILRYAEPEVTVAVLANGAQADPGAMAYGIAAAYRPELARPRPAPVAATDGSLADYAGVYTFPFGDTVRIRVDAGGLSVEGMARQAVRYEPVGDGDFVRDGRVDRLRFERRDGRVVWAWTGPPGAATVRIRRVQGDGAAGPAASADGAAAPSSAVSASSGDLVFTDARLVDGTGAPERVADVRVRGDRIVEVGDLRAGPGDTEIDASGLVLAPGFIDTHSHHDRGLDERPDARAAVSQGITTIVAGQDGGSPFPLADFFAAVAATPPTVNVAAYVGHNALRSVVMGDDFRREATPGEVAAMQALLRAELEAGALGLSTGLEYDPGIYSSTAEVMALARETAAVGGRYISHMRSEDRNFFGALDEALRIGRETGVPVQISHMKLAMRSLWGRADEALARLDAARARGVDVTADVYPYEFWQSTMTVLFPDRRFTRENATFALEELAPPEGMIVAAYDPDTTYVGLTLAEIADRRGEDAVTSYLALIAEAEADGGAESVIARSMTEDDIATLLAWPHTNVSSDGSLAGRHPRGYGAFTRVLARHVRERGDLTLEEAVRKMTSLSAQNTGLRDRGVIRPGAFADLVLFDPDAVADRATPEEPQAASVGVEGVWVNGRRVWDGSRTTDQRPGRVLRRGG